MHPCSSQRGVDEHPWRIASASRLARCPDLQVSSPLSIPPFCSTSGFDSETSAEVATLSREELLGVSPMNAIQVEFEGVECIKEDSLTHDRAYFFASYTIGAGVTDILANILPTCGADPLR